MDTYDTLEGLLNAVGIDFEVIHLGDGPACDLCPHTLERAA